MKLLFFLFGGAITVTGLTGLAMLSVLAETAATRIGDVIIGCTPTLPEEDEEEKEDGTGTASQQQA
ncbi:MAG: hypothetical protein Kow00121_65260 [Elainellaceae cyanobacterium]